MATVEEALLEARSKLLLKVKVPVEAPEVRVFKRYCRKSPPAFRVWLPLVVIQVGKSWKDCEGSLLAPVAPRFCKPVALLKAMMGICR